MFEVKKYKVVYEDGYYQVYGYKLCNWWACIIHEAGILGGDWQFLKFCEEDDKTNKKKAIKCAQKMKDGKMGLHYYTYGYRKYYRTEEVEI